MNRKLHTCLLRLLPPLLCLLLVTGCASLTESIPGAILSPEETYEKTDASPLTVTDDPALYAGEEADILTVYLAVGLGNEADGTHYTWSQINAVPLAEQGAKPYQCEAVLQFGDETAPTEGSFGYGALTPNAVVRLQGANASTRQQKSYRLSIKDGKGSVDGIKTLVLSKSFTDPLRVTNKLCYELLETIPHLFSARTRLVHLYVKDTTSGGNPPYTDYGLYTMVEPINKTYFKNRGLDGDGALYKSNGFDFARHEDALTLSTSLLFRQEAFEALLEIKGDNDHSKLLAMLDAVNDPAIPIETVIDTYFDADNLYRWLAFNLLTGNGDAADNCYLYSPTGSARFYFLSWDNDGAFRADYEALRDPGRSPSWDTGIFSFCDNVLFSRMFESEVCRSALSKAVDELYTTFLTPEAVSAALSRLTGLAEELVYTLPDRTFARVTRSQYDDLASRLCEQVTANYYAYYESLEAPAPFHILEPERLADGSLLLSWEPSSGGGQVTYRAMLDDAWDFRTPLKTNGGWSGTEWVIDPLPPGQYFLSVTARAADGRKQIAYETYSTELNTTVHGVLCFYVLPDGSVHGSYFNEGD